MVATATQGSRIGEPTAWQDLGVPYVIFATPNGGIAVDDTSFTLEPGVEIRFGLDTHLVVHRGSLNIVGTQMNPIRLIDEDGQWRGVGIDRSTAQFAYMSLSNAGSESFGTVSEAGAVTVTTSGGDPSTLALGPEVSQSGADDGLVFGYGFTVATGGCGKRSGASSRDPPRT